MHHIGIGRAHAATTVIVLVDDLDIRVINNDTGELFRHLTLNPDIDYQPTKNDKDRTQHVGSVLADVSRHHNGGGGGI